MDASGRAAPDEVAARLRSAGEKLGTGWATRPDLARHVLGDLLPDDPEAADALAAAAEAGMVDRVGSVRDLDPLARELASGSSLDQDLSGWSLRVWQAYSTGAPGPVPSAAPAAPEDRAEAARTALRRGRTAAGTEIDRDPVLARRVLADLLPHDPAAVSVLVAAVRDGVPGELAKDLPRLPAELVLPRLAEALAERESIAPDRARWAVAVWAAALGLADGAAIGAETVVRAAPAGEETVVRPQAVEAAAAEIPTGAAASSAVPPSAPAGKGQPPRDGGGTTSRPRRRRIPLLIAAAVVVVGALVAGIWVAGHPGRASDAAGAGAVKTAAAARTPSASPTPSVTPTPTAPPAIVVAAHRGGSEQYVEETQPALLAAASSSGVAAETDMRWTSDGVPVLAHDDVVTAPMICTGANPHPRVSATTYAALTRDCHTEASASKSGGRYPIPKMADVAAGIGRTAGGQWLLEIKTPLSPQQEGMLFDTLQHEKVVDRTVLTSFTLPELAKAGAEAKRRGLSIRLLLFVSSTTTITATAAKADGLWSVAVQDTVFAKDPSTPDYVSRLNAAGVRAVEWTPNDPAAWQRALHDGVEFVLTDYPGRWRQWRVSH